MNTYYLQKKISSSHRKYNYTSFICYSCFVLPGEISIMFPISRISAIIFLEIATFGICSNIDTSYPIILKNSADGADSLFGTTVQLLSKDGQYPGFVYLGNCISKSVTKNCVSLKNLIFIRIIIGAPKANSTLPKHMNIKEPGVLWQCSLDVSTGTGNACRVLVMDPTG